MNLIFFVPISILLILSPQILVGFGQNAKVSEQAGVYLMFFLPGIILMG